MTQLSDRAPVRRRPTRRWRLVGVVAILTLLLLVGGYLLLAPHDDVPMPGRNATPEQVVEAYIDAVNARDFETSNAIFPSGAQAPRGLFSGYERIELVSIDRVDGDKQDDAWVHFTAEFKGGDGSLHDVEKWGYVLARNDEGYWRIVGQGVI